MKKLMRRLSTALILVLIFSICFTLVNFAQEGDETAGEVITPTDTENEPENGLNGSEGAMDAFLAVVKTIVGEDFVKMGSMVIEIALLIILVLLKRTNKVTMDDIIKAVSAKNTKGERVSLAEVVSALNGIVADNKEDISAFKTEMSDKLKELVNTYSQQTVTHEQVSELAEAMKAMLGIFHTIYSQSKTIGANVKEEEGRLYNEAMNHILALESEDPANVV